MNTPNRPDVGEAPGDETAEYVNLPDAEVVAWLDMQHRKALASGETWSYEGVAAAKLRALARLSPPAPGGDAVRIAGAKLSNCAFNLAQDDRLPEHVRASLDSARREWDAAIAAAPASGGSAEPDSYPECSGNPADCPENEGFGCCGGRTLAAAPAPAVAGGGAVLSKLREWLGTDGTLYKEVAALLVETPPAEARTAVEREALHTLPADADGLNAAWRALEKWLGTWADAIPAQAYHQLCAMQQEMMAAAAPRYTQPAEAREPVGDAVAWLHTIQQGGGEHDQALSFASDNFPLGDELGFRSLGAVPLFTQPPSDAEPFGWYLAEDWLGWKKGYTFRARPTGGATTTAPFIPLYAAPTEAATVGLEMAAWSERLSGPHDNRTVRRLLLDWAKRLTTAHPRDTPRDSGDAKNAARYLWLKANAINGSIGLRGNNWLNCDEPEAEWDDAIDAAMQSPTGEPT